MWLLCSCLGVQVVAKELLSGLFMCSGCCYVVV